MSKILINTTASPIAIIDVGVVTIPGFGSYTIPPQDYLLFGASSNTVTFVGDGDLVVNDGSVNLSISDGIDLIKGIYPQYFVFAPTVENIVLTDADAEYAHILPAATRRYMMIVRGPGSIKYSFAVATSGSTYVKLIPGAFVSNGDIGAPSVTIYLQSPVAGTVVEIESWT